MTYSLSKHENCDIWGDEGECVKNPGFMYTTCNDYCRVGALDDDDRCVNWANEGECTHNPRYIQIHCPSSCSKALSWSPWARRAAGIPEITELDDDPAIKNCQNADTTVFGLAQILYNRLYSFMSGYRVNGLGDGAPSDFNGYMGLCEAILYTARLYKLVESEGDLALKLDDFIEEVSAPFRNYDGDWMMRRLPHWMDILGELSDEILRHHKVIDKHGVCPSFGPEISHILSLLPSPPTSAETVPESEGVTPVLLSNGVTIPAIGLGTWQLEGEECTRIVEDAIAVGYRHIDTAEGYFNEEEIGVAIAKAIETGVVTRKDLFIATKLSLDTSAGYENTKSLVSSQLTKLHVDYIDLYMLHSPISDKQLQQETWTALEELYAAGTIKALGVSNFNSHELDALYASATIKPVIVQNKMDVYHIGKQVDPSGEDMEATCKRLGVLLNAYSPLSSYPFTLTPVFDPVIAHIAKKIGITHAQVVLRWILQRGAVAIPRSSNVERLKENLAVTSLPPLSVKDMELISTLTHLISSPAYKVAV